MSAYTRRDFIGTAGRAAALAAVPGVAGLGLQEPGPGANTAPRTQPRAPRTTAEAGQMVRHRAGRRVAEGRSADKAAQAAVWRGRASAATAVQGGGYLVTV